MALTAKPPVTPDGKQAGVAAAGNAPASSAQEFTWDDLRPPVLSPLTAVNSSIKATILDTTPEPIRQRAERSLFENALRVTAASSSSSARPRVDYRWDVQPVPTTEKGAEFAKLIIRYAKYRPENANIPFAAPGVLMGQVTARCGNPSWFRTDDKGVATHALSHEDGAFLGVRYSVRPFEARKDTKRLPGTGQ